MHYCPLGTLLNFNNHFEPFIFHLTYLHRQSKLIINSIILHNDFHITINPIFKSKYHSNIPFDYFQPADPIIQ